MSTEINIGYEGLEGEQTADEVMVDEDGFELAPEFPEMRPSVEMETRARLDYVYPDERPDGQTLEAEERRIGYEWEIAKTVVRTDRTQTSDREARTRAVVETQNEARRYEVACRAGSVDPFASPETPDPREVVSRAELGRINQEAMRLAGELRGWSRAAISRRLAERVVEGGSISGAVVGVFEELQQAPGQSIPIAAVGANGEREVTIRGQVTTLWEPSHPSIAQVGLIEDESGRTRFTVWKRSNQPYIELNEHVVLRDAVTSWHNGRVSVALTGRSSVSFPKRTEWWTDSETPR